MKNSLGHELAALLRLAGPLISAQLAHALMIFTDTLMMAMLGPQQLAGGALGATCYFIFSIFCTGVIAAVGSLVAIRHGAGDPGGVTRLLQSGLWLALLLDARARGITLQNPPAETALGALINHLRTPVKRFQPSNAHFGLMPELGERARKKDRKALYSARAQQAFGSWLQEARAAGLV